MTRNGLPLSSVRGIVRSWIERHAAALGTDVLEIGSRMHEADAWWINNRDLAFGKWTGMDMQEGLNVDVVADLYDMPSEWNNQYSGVLCCEVLEHVDYPWLALSYLCRILQPGGLIIITAPWCFPKHNCPNDYYRYSPDGLKALLEYAGFDSICVEASAPQVRFDLNGYGHGPNYVGDEPTHSCAIARRPL